MFGGEDCCEEIGEVMTRKILKDVFIWLSDDNQLLFPESRRESILERYDTKDGPTQFEIKLAAISKESFQNSELESTLKKHYTKLEMEKQASKNKEKEVLSKRIKDIQNEVTFSELLSSAKKSCYKIEAEKMKPKEIEVNIKPKQTTSIKNEFLQDAIPRKYKIENEKNDVEKLKQTKRKCEKTVELTKKHKTTYNSTIITVPSLVDDVVVRKLRIEKEKEQMLKAKQVISNKQEPVIKIQNKAKDTQLKSKVKSTSKVVRKGKK